MLLRSRNERQSKKQMKGMARARPRAWRMVGPQRHHCWQTDGLKETVPFLLLPNFTLYVLGSPIYGTSLHCGAPTFPWLPKSTRKHECISQLYSGIQSQPWAPSLDIQLGGYARGRHSVPSCSLSISSTLF